MSSVSSVDICPVASGKLHCSLQENEREQGTWPLGFQQPSGLTLAIIWTIHHSFSALALGRIGDHKGDTLPPRGPSAAQMTDASSSNLVPPVGGLWPHKTNSCAVPSCSTCFPASVWVLLLGPLPAMLSPVLGSHIPPNRAPWRPSPYCITSTPGWALSKTGI